MDVEKQKIAKRIKAILAKAHSSTFEGEAAAFMAKAESLMSEHGISMLDAETADNPIGEQQAMRVRGIWQRRLVDALAQFYGGNTLYIDNGNSSFQILLFGTETTRIMVCEMWPYIKKSVGRQASKAISENNVRLPRDKVKEHISNALVLRIHDLIEARRDKGTGNGTDLVLGNQVQAFIDNLYPPEDLLPSKRSKFEVSGLAERYAKNIGLDDQVKGKGDSGPLLLE